MFPLTADIGPWTSILCKRIRTDPPSALLSSSNIFRYPGRRSQYALNPFKLLYPWLIVDPTFSSRDSYRSVVESSHDLRSKARSQHLPVPHHHPHCPFNHSSFGTGMERQNGLCLGVLLDHNERQCGGHPRISKRLPSLLRRSKEQQNIPISSDSDTRQ